jgi:hypothetical protein
MARAHSLPLWFCRGGARPVFISHTHTQRPSPCRSSPAPPPSSATSPQCAPSPPLRLSAAAQVCFPISLHFSLPSVGVCGARLRGERERERELARARRVPGGRESARWRAVGTWDALAGVMALCLYWRDARPFGNQCALALRAVQLLAACLAFSAGAPAAASPSGLGGALRGALSWRAQCVRRMGSRGGGEAREGDESPRTIDFPRTHTLPPLRLACSPPRQPPQADPQ